MMINNKRITKNMSTTTINQWPRVSSWPIITLLYSNNINGNTKNDTIV